MKHVQLSLFFLLSVLSFPAVGQSPPGVQPRICMMWCPDFCDLNFELAGDCTCKCPRVDNDDVLSGKPTWLDKLSSKLTVAPARKKDIITFSPVPPETPKSDPVRGLVELNPASANQSFFRLTDPVGEPGLGPGERERIQERNDSYARGKADGYKEGFEKGEKYGRDSEKATDAIIKIIEWDRH